MVLRLSRLALAMMLHGPVHTARTMRGLDAGEWIDLLPPMDGATPRSTVLVEFGRDGCCRGAAGIGRRRPPPGSTATPFSRPPCRTVRPWTPRSHHPTPPRPAPRPLP